MMMAKVPTDNPIATYYNGNDGYPAWTDEIKWDNTIDMGTYTNGSDDFAKFENARDELYAQGGGVLYYPPGEYDFSAMPADGFNGRGLMLKSGVVIRGATPIEDNIARDDGNLDLLTTFKFPWQTKAGGEVPRDWNFIGLMPTENESSEDVSNVGLVWVNVVGGTLWWGPEREWGETWATAGGWKSDRVKPSWANRIPDGTHPWDAFAGSPTSGTEVGIGKGRLVFGSSFTDSAVINNAIDEGFGKDGFYMAKFGPRIGVYGSRVLVANNTLPPSTKNFKYNQITNNHSESTLLFDYGKTLGIDVNKSMLGAYQSDAGYYAEGVAVIDNWVGNHGHKGYDLSGTWMTVRNNHNEREYLTENVPAIYGLDGTYELTLDGYRESQAGGSGSVSDNLSRAFDLSGKAIWVDRNTLNNTGSDPGNDGEGILWQRHGGTDINSVAITNNTHLQGSGEAGYFGGYDVHNYGHLSAWNQTPGWVGHAKAGNNDLIDSAFIANNAEGGIRTDAGGIRDVITADPLGSVSAPIKVTAKVQPEEDSVLITWEDTTTNEIGFRVERSIEGGEWTTIAYRPRQSMGSIHNQQAWVDFMAPRDRALRYRVVAIQSDDSNTGASKPTEAIALTSPTSLGAGVIVDRTNTGVSTPTEAIALTSPNSLGAGVIVDEDFTTGAFAADTSDYWTINGSGIAFRPPNQRNFDFALSNRIAEGGGSFADNLVFNIPDPETTHPSGKRQFGINKLDEVAVVRYQTFSDVAKNSRERFHVQVAMVQADPELTPPPDFGHDLSFETESRFVSLNVASTDRVQLTANVENQEIDGSDPQKEAQKKAYFEATMTAADLDREYTNLVLWRDRSGTGTTNIEQWGNNRLGDYYVPSEMVNQLPRNQDPNYSLFNEIEIFLQRGGTNVDLLRNNVNVNDAQIGLKDIHVGITKKTDFNLDYRTDAADFIRWNTYQNLGGTPTMQTGDADNDGDIDRDDLAQLQLYLGQIHDPNFAESQSVYTYNPDSALNNDYIIPNGSEEEPIFAYNRQTGELLVNTKGQALNAWIIRGQVANSVKPINNGNWWMQTVGNTQQWLDLDLNGFSSTELTPIATFAPGLNLNDFGKVEVGFATGGGRLVDVVAYNSYSSSSTVANELFFKKEIDGAEYIYVTPYPVSEQFLNTSWTEEQENEFIKRYNQVIAAQGSKTSYGGRFFEQEKRSYPRAMLSYIWGVANNNSNSIEQAKNFLQAGDVGGDSLSFLTQGVDYFPSFTLKTQVTKYFYFGQLSQSLGLDYLDSSYTDTMYLGADTWVDDNWVDAETGIAYSDPLWRPNPIYNPDKDPELVGGENWTPSGRNSWVDIRNTDNLEAMREVAIYLMAEETGNTVNRDRYAQNYLERVASNWQTGIREWDSPNYFAWTAAANLNMYDFAPEEGEGAKIKKAAKASLDQNFTAAALKYYRGGLGGTNLRNTTPQLPFNGSASFYHLYFGDSPLSDPDPDKSNSIHALLSSYRPPQAVVDLAQKDFSKHIEILATKSPYLEDIASKPSEPKTPAIDTPRYFETNYYGNTYHLGTLVAPDSPSDYQAELWNVTTFKLTVDNSVRGVDFFGANTSSLDLAASKNLEDRIAQYQNMALWLRPADGNSFYFMAPDPTLAPGGTGTVIQDEGIWFFQLENTWIALRPINLVFRTQANGVKNASEIEYVFDTVGDNYAGFALEIGEQGNSNQPGVFSDFDSFKNAVKSKTLDLSQLSQGDVTLNGTDGSFLRMIHNPLTDLPTVYRNSSQAYDFTDPDNFALYRSINQAPTAEIVGLTAGQNFSVGETVTINANASDTGNRGPIAMEWKQSSLSILSGTPDNPGWLFEEQLDDNLNVTWSEREATAEDYLGQIKRVEFWLNDELISEDRDNSDGWNVDWNPDAPGDYILQVRAIDNDAQIGWSKPLEVSVTDSEIDKNGLEIGELFTSFSDSIF
ncbi:MAG: hypothetical protein QNJ41_00440 [Xenococcaceae cyanobacterium MO_188.B32]|nr:hypothetical protein [Xenococcaceae cyanobacterium MO_188.B32]